MKLRNLVAKCRKYVNDEWVVAARLSCVSQNHSYNRDEQGYECRSAQQPSDHDVKRLDALIRERCTASPNADKRTEYRDDRSEKSTFGRSFSQQKGRSLSATVAVLQLLVLPRES
jgi:hypothetical protein